MSASSEQVAEAVANVPAGVALHARPAGIVSREAMGFASAITLIAGERQADAKSVLRVMALGAEGGTTVVIRAEGEDAAAAAARIAELIDHLA